MLVTPIVCSLKMTKQTDLSDLHDPGEVALSLALRRVQEYLLTNQVHLNEAENRVLCNRQWELYE